MRQILLALLLFASSSKPLFETKSRYSHIIVDERDGVRHLRFDSVTQSSARVGDPKFLVHDYTQAAMLGWALTQAQRVLVIGLGGGSIPMFIRAHDPKIAIDVVEIDPTVLDVATRYFAFREDPLLKVYIEDGAEFVRRVQQQYDLVILDAYAPDFIPEQLATAAFFTTVKEKLRPGGVLASNVWGPPNPAYDKMLATQGALFAHLSVVKARHSGNQIFLALQRPLDKPTLVAAARALAKRYAFSFDLADIAERGFLR